MKKLIVLALAAATSGIGFADTLSPEAALARVKAESDVNSVRILTATAKSEPRLVKVGKFADITAYYAFATDNQTIIVGADDLSYPLLGYIDNGCVDFDNLPPQMKWWLDEYGRQIEWANVNAMTKSNTENSSEESAGDERQPISPLLTTEWGQAHPFNQQCPDINYNPTLTGCTATAMAQVMNYFRWPEGCGSGEVSYEWNDQTLSLDFSTISFDWDNMLDRYDSSKNAQRNAVSTLMKACGYAIESDYGLNGTGASCYVVATSLVKYFNYDKATRTELRDFYSSDDVWEELIYDNLKNVGPVLYCGGSDEGGHAFVCDGYDSDGYFHINWGWTGKDDGYFKLDALLQSGGAGYNSNQVAIIGAQKPQAESSYPSPYIGLDGDLVVETEGRYISFSIENGHLANYGDYSGDFFIGAKFADMSDPSIVYLITLASRRVESFWAFGFNMSGTLPDVLPGGEYMVNLVYQLTDEDYCSDVKVWGNHRGEVRVTIPDVSGIIEIDASVDTEEAKWYNLQGVAVDGENLPAGIYIKVQGGKSSKVIVK